MDSILVKIEVYITDRIAPTGRVTAHETTISFTVSARTLLRPRANPTPMTAPTSVWVAEIGSPNLDAPKTTDAAANSAAKPLVGVNSVILFPIVDITLYPHIISPETIPNPPQARTSVGINISIPPVKPPPWSRASAAANGPMALETSLPP